MPAAGVCVSEPVRPERGLHVRGEAGESLGVGTAHHGGRGALLG